MRLEVIPRRRLLRWLGGGFAGIAAACSHPSSRKPASTSTATPPPPATPLPPTPTVTPEPEATLEQKIAAMLLVGFKGTSGSDLDPLVDEITVGRLDNVVLFERNIVSPVQLRTLNDALQSRATGRLLIAVDEEGGYVARLGPKKGFPVTLTAEQLGTLNDLSATYNHAAAIASTLRDAGINLNLAPVVDVNSNPDNPVIGRYGRSFSADPEAVAAQALAFIRAHHDQGVLCTLKHFPGHGSSTADSHRGLVDVTGTWSQRELVPFRRIIEAGEADVIMTAHIFNANLDPAYPATLSYDTVTGILRNRLGFDGVVTTDDLNMAAIQDYFGFDRAVELAILAGVDVLAVANSLTYSADAATRTFEAVMKAVRKGSVTEERIDESYQRIARLRSRLA